MKDQIKNHVEPEENFSDALKSVVQKIEVNARFKAELGKQLTEAYQPARLGFGQSAFNRAIPVFGWVFALALMALVLNWMFRSIAPPPIPAAQETPSQATQDILSPSPTDLTTPIPEGEGFDWRGGKLYLAQPLPQSPAEANVYLKKITEQATRENVLALAQRFEINGEIQEVPGDIPGETNYRISDGRERLEVRSDHYFTYHSNFGEQLYLDNLSEGQARIIADNFLKKHDFDFEYKLESAPEMQGTQFYILPLTPDGYKMRFDYMQPVRYQIFLDSTGENIIFTGYPIEYESVGTFGIITVEDALQKILDPNPQSGLMEIFHGQRGGGGGSSFHELNLSGTPVPFPSPTAQPQTNEGAVEYIVQEGDTVLGIAQDYGITPEKIVQANSWLSDGHVLTPGKTLIIPSGYTEQHAVGERIEGMRGIIVVNIYRRPDGSQRVEYWFLDIKNINGEGTTPNYLLSEGTDLQDLQDYHHRPVDIWGTIDRLNRYGEPVIKVDRFEIPYPDLQIQILEGTQKITEIQGGLFVTLTTKDGTTYIQLGPAGEALNQGSLVRNEGDNLLVEALVIPNETFGGYPTLRTFGFILAVDPVSGIANEISIMADQPYIMQEEFSPENNIPPTATIEKVELIYYTPDPRYAPPGPNLGPQYIQPAWRFYGHYSNGDEFEILVQALKEEYLLPELAPYTPPG